MLHVVGQSKVSLDDGDAEDPNDIAQRIYDWCVSSYQDSDTQEVIGIIGAELPKLQEIQTGGEA